MMHSKASNCGCENCFLEKRLRRAGSVALVIFNAVAASLTRPTSAIHPFYALPPKVQVRMSTELHSCLRVTAAFQPPVHGIGNYERDKPEPRTSHLKGRVGHFHSHQCAACTNEIRFQHSPKTLPARTSLNENRAFNSWHSQ